MKEIVLWGATGQAKVVYEALLTTDYRIVALVDNRVIKSPLSHVPVLLGEAGLNQWLNKRESSAKLYFSVAVGGARCRDRLELKTLLKRKGLVPLTIVHPSSFVAKDATLDEGCQIMAQAAVCTRTHLGNFVIVNTAASVDHDCVIAAGAHLGPGARLAGEVTVGKCAFIGMGAIILPRLSIGADAVVGAGAVVTRDVQPQETVVGNPARVYKRYK